jgi:hypothetical protein
MLNYAARRGKKQDLALFMGFFGKEASISI